MIGQMGGQQVLILKEGTRRERGKSAHTTNISAAKAVADIVRTTLGPKGMDKMLVSGMGDVTITNDGATILKELDTDHPAAKMIVEVSKTQDQEAGDGTTSATIMTGSLLDKAEGLIESGVHPTVIAGGYRRGLEKALEILDQIALKVGPEDKKALADIARTSMYSKSVSGAMDNLAVLAVDAVIAITETRDGKRIANIDNIQIMKRPGGGLGDTKMIDGIILDKEPVHSEMPKTIKGVKIALLDCALEIKKTEVEAKIEIDDPAKVGLFLAEEEKRLKAMADTITKSGANVVVCQKGIADLVQYFLAKGKVWAIQRARQSDLEKLQRATGAKILSSLDDLNAGNLGKAGKLDSEKFGEEDLAFITGCPGAKAVSIFLRGSTEQVLGEAERSLHDALCVIRNAVEDGKMLAGGGSVEMEVAKGLRDFAPTVGGREQLAIELFADAVEVIPKTLAENAGLDPIDVLLDLRQAHTKGKTTAGIDVNSGKVVDMKEARVLQPLRVTRQALRSAVETANMILRIDDIIASRASPSPPPGGPGGGHGGHGMED